MKVKQPGARRRSARARRDGLVSAHPLVAELPAGVDVPSVARPPARLSHDRRNIDPSAVRASQRWRLLAATAHVIATDGYGLTTIDRICSEAGVTKKTFYKFFGTKEAAFLACYEAVDVLIDRVVAAGIAAGGGADALRTITEGYLAALAAAPDLTKIFLFEAIAASPRIRRQRAAYIERLAEGLQRVVAARREDDSSISALTKADMTLLLGGINELCVLHMTHHDVATLPRLAGEIRRLVLRFLKKPES